MQTAITPQSEHDSIEAMKEALRGRTEECVAVVCHWGVINALCGDGPTTAPSSSAGGVPTATWTWRGTTIHLGHPEQSEDPIS